MAERRDGPEEGSEELESREPREGEEREEDEGGFLSLFYHDGDEAPEVETPEEAEAGRAEEGERSPDEPEEELPGALSEAEAEQVATPGGRAGGRRGLFPWLRIREEVSLPLAWLLGTLPVLALLGVWWALTAGAVAEERIISPVILPSPVEVVRSFPSLWFDRALTRNTLVSFGRVLGGFLVGLAIAFPLGLAMGAFTKIRAMFNPLAVFGAYTPIPALVPLTLSFFGTGEKQKIIFLAMASVIYLLPLVVSAVEDVDEIYLKTAYTLGASKLQAVTKVLLAVSWQNIYQALRLGFGIGWTYIILVEMVDIGSGGLGSLILLSQRQGPREHIYLVLLVIVALAFITDKVWQLLGRKLFPYREAHR